MSINLQLFHNGIKFIENLLNSPIYFKIFKCLITLIMGSLIYLCNSNESHASCTTTGSTNTTYTYTAATINTPASITFTGSWTCKTDSFWTQYGTSKNICSKVVFSGNTSSINGSSLPYTITNLSVGGLTQSQISTNTWYGPATTVASNNVLNYSITVTVPNQSNTLIASPKGTYTGTLQLYMDMQQNDGSCEGNSGGGWDSSNKTLTFNYIVPSLCQFNSSNTVDFGTIADIGQASKNYDANGAIFSTCNPGTPYTIYLGDGNNRISGGNRQMSSANNYLQYQLYKNSTRTSIWDTTGGTTTGGSGGVSSTGTGSSQSTPVYGRIPSGTTIPVPGNYTDTVIVNVTY